MTNSDSGNRPRPAAHQPGDRVRIRHNPRHDHHSYSVEQNRARQALGGQIATIRERTAADAYRVAPPGSTERGAWFEADELEPVDAQPSFAGDIHAAAVALETRWRAAEQAAEEAERQAKDARQEAARVSEALRRAEAERDALRGKLGAAEADSATLHTALVAERKESAGWRSRALAAEAKIPRETEEVARLEAALRTRDVQLNESRTQRKAAEARLAAVAQAWGKMRAFLLALPRPFGAAGIEGVDMVDAALGGVAAKPAERECCWEQTVEQRVSEIEARLGRLESGEALAKMLEGYGDARRP